MTKLSELKINWVILLLFCAAGVTTNAQDFNTLLNFSGENGWGPQSALVQGRDGSLYGTTFSGGENEGCDSLGCGTVFKVAPSGGLATLYRFCADHAGCTDGYSPMSGLVLALDGNLYGTTFLGGNSLGTVFKISSTGKLTTLYRFTGADGANPLGGLIQATDGNFYGTTQAGGDLNCNLGSGCGTVFQITSTGVLTTLHKFNVTDGFLPDAGLFQGADGSLYGTTPMGGTENAGTAFRITRDDVFTVLHNFMGTPSDGVGPSAIIQGSDGHFYGTTLSGGKAGAGTVFRMSVDGQVEILHSFCEHGSPCLDGSYPRASLLQGTDGYFYGTTGSGGHGSDCELSCGTTFRVSTSGTLATLHSFDNPSYPVYPQTLVQDTNGEFYGLTTFGGQYDGGTLYRLDMGLGPFVTFVRFAGKVGDVGPILGQGFTGTSSVSINGIEADFTVISDTHIRATVPPGATTGYVTVTTPTGVLKSNVPFHVIQ